MSNYLHEPFQEPEPTPADEFTRWAQQAFPAPTTLEEALGVTERTRESSTPQSDPLDLEQAIRNDTRENNR